MKSWNVRKLWHSWLKTVAMWLSLVIGLVFLIVAVTRAATEDWGGAAGWLVSGGPLVVVSLGLINSARNEPNMTLCTSEEEIKAFMRKFISLGSTVHISSYNLSWVRGDESMRDFLTDAVREGKNMTILAAGPDDFTNGLSGSGIKVVAYPSDVDDCPRFTLLNMGASGRERIAVAREGLPNHWIDVYDVKHHPQVIAIARAYIRSVSGAI